MQYYKNISKRGRHGMDIVDSSFLAIIIVVIKGGTLRYERYEWAMECVIANIPLHYLSIRKKVNMEYTFNFTTEQQFYP